MKPLFDPISLPWLRRQYLRFGLSFYRMRDRFDG